MNRGAVAVEFVIVLPLLLFLIFGMIEFCLFMYNKQILTNAVREGARWGVLMRAAPRNLTAEKAQIKAKVMEWCYNENTNEIKMISFGNNSAPVVSDPIYEPTRANEVVLTGDTLTVEATFKHTFLVLPNIFELLGSTENSAELNICAKSIMYME